MFISLCLSVAYIGDEFFITSGHYFVYFISGISLLCCSSNLLFGAKTEIHISILDLVVFVLIVYLFINGLVVSKFSAGYLPFCLLCCCWVAYTVAKQQIKIPLCIPMIILLILISGVVQCTLGLFQYFDIVPGRMEKLKPIGSLHNSGVYANYIACIFPLALAVLLYSKRQIKKVLFLMSLLFIACCVFVMPFTMARSAWLGMLAGTIVVTQYRYSWISKITGNIKKTSLLFVIVAIIIIVSYAGNALYHLKPESAQGRLLIYKIALGICKDQPLLGTGFNTFAREYNFYQADYFALGTGSETEKWLADANQMAFNEYLQIAVETGLIGLALLLTVGGVLIYYRKQIHTPYAIGAVGALSTLACCACFSYPFHEISIVVLVGLMLSIAGTDFKPLSISTSVKMQKSIPVGTLLVTVFLCYYSIKSISLVSRWERLVSHTSVSDFEDVREQYALLYAQLDNNPYFLYNYGIELVLAKEYEQGILVLQHTCHYFIDTDILCYLGDAYKGLNQYDKAESNYQLASNMVPVKFYPLYCLAKLYSETGRKKESLAMAQTIINKDIKIASYMVTTIKNEMRQFIEAQKISDAPENYSRINKQDIKDTRQKKY